MESDNQTVWHTRIKSSSGFDSYLVMYRPTLGYTCSCPGFIYHDKCKHLIQAKKVHEKEMMEWMSEVS